LDEFARIRRLEVHATVAALVALGRVLIVGGCLADLYLRHGLRHSRSGCHHTERNRRAAEHHSTSDALAIVPAAIHDRLRSGLMLVPIS